MDWRKGGLYYAYFGQMGTAGFVCRTTNRISLYFTVWSLFLSPLLILLFEAYWNIHIEIDDLFDKLLSDFRIGFIFHCVIINWLKWFFRRRRPAPNKDFFLFPGSFPSARASYATFILYRSYVSFLPSICVLFLFVWWLLIWMSRLLMKKNHSCDVVGGIVIGFFLGTVFD